MKNINQKKLKSIQIIRSQKFSFIFENWSIKKSYQIE